MKPMPADFRALRKTEKKADELVRAYNSLGVDHPSYGLAKRFLREALHARGLIRALIEQRKKEFEDTEVEILDYPPSVALPRSHPDRADSCSDDLYD